MSTSKRPGIAIYNPDILTEEELLAVFIARRPLLDRLLAELRGADKGGSQHHLIIGPHGMGKTTLLRRLGYGIGEDKKLSKRFLPLSFPEAQYNVARLSDFWANCLDALSDALDRAGHASEAARIDEQVASLERQDEEPRAKAALGALLSWAEKGKKTLVLLVDNVDLVLHRLKEHHWAIRELLSEEKRLVLIGASSAALEYTFEYGSAFYDFFKLDELRGLDEEESRQLLLHLAKVRRTPRVAEGMDKDPGRFRALHALTGGNPRILVLLYNVLALDEESDVYQDLERLLDQCTPLYRARFEELPAQAQQIVDAVALHWDPITAATLAQRVRLPVNAVSAQLNRLGQMGVIEKVSLGTPSKAGFQVAERLFNLWCLMRASPRVRRRLIWLVEFLRIFHAEAEIEQRAERLVASDGGQDVRYGALPESEPAYSAAMRAGNWKRALEAMAVEWEARRGGESVATTARTSAERAHAERSWHRVEKWCEVAARQGQASEAAALLEKLGWTDRLRPLHVALMASVTGSSDVFLSAAPEVRAVAELLHQRFSDR